MYLRESICEEEQNNIEALQLSFGWSAVFEELS